MSSITLTQKELELLKEVGKYIQTSAVDWDGIAKKLGYPAPKRARDKWYPLRDKLFGAEGGAAPKKTATPRKRKGSDEEGATPAAKKKRGKKADTPVEEDDDEEVKPKPEPEVDAEEDGEMV